MTTDDAFGYVLHNLVTGEDIQTETEADALAATSGIDGGHDWSLWRLRRDGTGEAIMVAVGTGPVPSQ